MLDVIIIGAGVSGLTAARALSTSGRSFEVVEARSRTGGRALSPGGVDLGPTWVWDSEQSVHTLLTTLGLETYAHFDSGTDIFEGHDGLQRGRFPRSPVPSRQIVGGVQALTDRLAESIRVQLDTRVLGLAPCLNGVRVDTSRGILEARNVLAALPPRLVADWDPSLAALARVPVWMGAIAKVVATFEHAFWRHSGLSGRAASALGPMVEIHDMSTAHAHRLFGFVPQSNDDGALEEAVNAQFARLFGRHPAHTQVQRWYDEPETWRPHAENDRLLGHPGLSTPLMEGRLHLISAETSTTSPGHLDGAIERANQATFELAN